MAVFRSSLFSLLIAFVVFAFFGGCRKPDAGPSEPEAVASATCLTAAESQTNAKPHRNAEPPFEACAAGVFAHCGGENGERGGYGSNALDVELTKRARRTNPDSCCYRSCP